jgi:hypothetical protein
MSFRALENAVVWTPREIRNNDWDGFCSCVWRVCNKLHLSYEPCVWRHRFCMTTKSPTLNISTFVHSSVWDFENPGHTPSLPRIFPIFRDVIWLRGPFCFKWIPMKFHWKVAFYLISFHIHSWKMSHTFNLISFHLTFHFDREMSINEY